MFSRRTVALPHSVNHVMKPVSCSKCSTTRLVKNPPNLWFIVA